MRMIKKRKMSSIQGEKTILEEYKRFCKRMGYTISGQIHKFMQMELSGSWKGQK